MKKLIHNLFCKACLILYFVIIAIRELKNKIIGKFYQD